MPNSVLQYAYIRLRFTIHPKQFSVVQLYKHELLLLSLIFEKVGDFSPRRRLAEPKIGAKPSSLK